MNVLDQTDYDVIRLKVPREELADINLAFKDSSVPLFDFFIKHRAVLNYLLFPLSPYIETLRLLKLLFPVRFLLALIVVVVCGSAFTSNNSAIGLSRILSLKIEVYLM